VSPYFVALDGGDCWTLWRVTGDPDFPEPILSKTWANTELWTLALRGAEVKDPS
jgi:hypothetical protein